MPGLNIFSSGHLFLPVLSLPSNHVVSIVQPLFFFMTELPSSVK